jgi:hypothetical protein
MKKHRLIHTAALALTALAVAAPTAGASSDLRNPDQRSAAPSGGTSQDFRSADARDSQPVESRAQVAQDYRSADTRDVAAGRGIPEVTVVKVAQPAASPSSGLDWGDAGIGAGFLLGLILLGLGTTQVVMHRKQRQPAITR